ncbi:hypothetical protein LINPERHAP1_LOCUS29455 [Linum perenne]
MVLHHHLNAAISSSSSSSSPSLSPTYAFSSSSRCYRFLSYPPHTKIIVFRLHFLFVPNRSRTVSLRPRNFGICRCIATYQEDKTQSAYKTNVPRNANMGKLQAGYLFPEVR